MIMKTLRLFRFNLRKQYIYSILIVLCMSTVCFLLTDFISYQVVALILLLTMSLLAITFDILPVLASAILSAFIWDFFFIRPRFTFHVASTEDSILLIMYFVIAMINAVLTYKIRQIEKIAREKEQKANAVKLYNTLLNSLSHELRTPIATIIGATDNLQLNQRNLSALQKEQLLAEISKASFRLNQHVENLLNMSRLESGFVQPRNDWCDINEIVYDVVRKIEEEQQANKIIINIKPGIPLFKLDKGMVEQIIYNLLSNAIRYTQVGSIININVQTNANLCRVIIEDNGPGFPDSEIPFVFDRFYRMKGSGTSGTGLGLSIVKGFTEALGGSVQLRNVSTGGSRFTIEIPAEISYL
jgi:two-component system sensor histidine kinase KdpD